MEEPPDESVDGVFPSSSASRSSARCVDAFAEGLYHGVFTGTGFGLFLALYERRKLPESNAYRQIRRCMTHSLLVFASALSAYHGVSCGVRRMRGTREGEKDLVAPAIGGAVGGLFITLHTRRWQSIVGASLGMALIAVMIPLLSTQVKTQPLNKRITQQRYLAWQPVRS